MCIPPRSALVVIHWLNNWFVSSILVVASFYTPHLNHSSINKFLAHLPKVQPLFPPNHIATQTLTSSPSNKRFYCNLLSHLHATLYFEVSSRQRIDQRCNLLSSKILSDSATVLILIPSTCVNYHETEECSAIQRVGISNFNLRSKQWWKRERCCKGDQLLSNVDTISHSGWHWQ